MWETPRLGVPSAAEVLRRQRRPGETYCLSLRVPRRSLFPSRLLPYHRGHRPPGPSQWIVRQEPCPAEPRAGAGGLRSPWPPPAPAEGQKTDSSLRLVPNAPFLHRPPVRSQSSRVAVRRGAQQWYSLPLHSIPVIPKRAEGCLRH